MFSICGLFVLDAKDWQVYSFSKTKLYISEFSYICTLK